MQMSYFSVVIVPTVNDIEIRRFVYIKGIHTGQQIVSALDKGEILNYHIDFYPSPFSMCVCVCVCIFIIKTRNSQHTASISFSISGVHLDLVLIIQFSFILNADGDFIDCVI